MENLSIMKGKVRIRSRKSKDGVESLYLDIYSEGIRRYEFLKLYLVPELRRADKAANQRTLQIAESIRMQKELELQSRSYDVVQSNITLEQAIEEYIEDRKGKSETVFSTIKGIQQDLRPYLHLPLAKINQPMAKDMANILSKRGSPNTVFRYQLILKAVFNLAVKNEHISKSPMVNVRLKPQEVERKYLSAEQVGLLWEQKDLYPIYQVEIYLFLFSCLTGLRISDMLALRWVQIKAQRAACDDQTTFYRVTFTQKKTKKLEYLDITCQAYELIVQLSELRGKTERKGLVFEDRKSDDSLKEGIRKITQRILGEPFTFHCARHTFATMMISRGADLYTVSKLLGHRNINTTQIYAKVVDKGKQEAMLLLPKFNK